MKRHDWTLTEGALILALALMLGALSGCLGHAIGRAVAGSVTKDLAASAEQQAHDKQLAAEAHAEAERKAHESADQRLLEAQTNIDADQRRLADDQVELAAAKQAKVEQRKAFLHHINQIVSTVCAIGIPLCVLLGIFMTSARMFYLAGGCIAALIASQMTDVVIEHLRTSMLIGVAGALAFLAEVLWQHYRQKSATVQAVSVGKTALDMLGSLGGDVQAIKDSAVVEQVKTRTQSLIDRALALAKPLTALAKGPEKP